MAWKIRTGRARGVTLAEILVGLVVLGVIAAVAVPAYRGYLLHVNRSDARRDLLAMARQLHRCFERAGDFRVNAAGSSTPCTNLPSTNAEGTYTVVFAPGEPTASGFRIAARPLGAQEADSGCGALTLDDQGHRGITGSREALDCWQESDD